MLSPINVSLGIDNIDAFCVLGSYEHAIIVSEDPVLSPITNTSNLSRFFNVSLLCPNKAANQLPSKS